MKMSKYPYVIQEITLITYSGRKLHLTIVENEIIDIPIRLTKNKILDAFASMKDKPVDVKLKVKYI